MISDSERREVAARLRQMADAHYAVETSRVARALGLEYEVYGTVVAFNSAAVQALADLIDLKTCEFKPTYESLQGFVTLVECSECGWKTEPWNAEDFRYCPNCRARVVRGGE